MANKLEDRIKRLLDTTESKETRTDQFNHINSEFVIALLQEGFHLPDIAKIYGCCPGTISYQLKREIRGFDARVYTRGQLRRKDITIEDVVELYRRFRSSNKIARMCKMNTHAITERLEKAGVKRRSLRREDVTHEKVLNLYQLHGRTTKVAEILHTNITLIRSRLSEIGIEVSRNYSPRPTITSEDILGLYQLHGSITKVAEILRLNSDLVRYRLKRLGICFKKLLPEEEIVKSYVSGQSITELSAKYETDFSRIRKVLSEHNVPIRPGGITKRYIEPDRIIKLYEKYGSLPRVAKTLHMSRSTLTRIINEEKVEIPRETYPAPPEEEVIDDYPQTDIKSLARKYNTSRHKIRRILIEQGIEIRRFSRLRKDVDIEKVKSLYEIYKSAPIVAEMLNTTSTTVYRRLKEAGLNPNKK